VTLTSFSNKCTIKNTKLSPHKYQTISELQKIVSGTAEDRIH